jgi:hypothetical protein
MNIRFVIFAVYAMPFLSGVGLAGNVASDDELPSVCYGDAASGRLERGRRLPYSGENYRAYSMVGFALGRTYVHSTVRDIMLDQRNGDLVRRTESLGLHGEVQNAEQKLRGISGETEAVHRAGLDGVSNTKVAITRQFASSPVEGVLRSRQCPLSELCGHAYPRPRRYVPTADVTRGVGTEPKGCAI